MKGVSKMIVLIGVHLFLVLHGVKASAGGHSHGGNLIVERFRQMIEYAVDSGEVEVVFGAETAKKMKEVSRKIGIFYLPIRVDADGSVVPAINLQKGAAGHYLYNKMIVRKVEDETQQIIREAYHKISSCKGEYVIFVGIDFPILMDSPLFSQGLTVVHLAVHELLPALRIKDGPDFSMTKKMTGLSVKGFLEWSPLPQP